MKQISFEEFKTIYKQQYKLVVDLLVKNGVPFSSGCGTMLGAIRNNDIIEWDYDIDNFFFIEDVDKLLSIKEQLPDNLYFESYLDGKLRYGLVRILFKNLFRHDRKSSRYLNVWIDFFAIRNVEISESRRKRIFANVLKEEAKTAFKNTKYKSKNFLKECVKRVYQFFLPSYQRSSKRIERKVKRLKEGTTCLMCRNCRLVSTVAIDKNDVIFVDFGGFKIPCYSNYKNVLESLFGKTWETPIVYKDRTIPEFYIE